MPRKPATEAQRQAIRQSIQRAAAEVYRQEGLAGVTARGIAKRAGVSVGTLYSYFENLPALMQTLWREPLEKINQRFIDAVETVHPPLERLHVLMATYVDFALENPRLYRGAFLYVRPEAMPKSERLYMREEVFPALLIEALEAGQAEGVIQPSDPELQAQYLWSGLHGCLALPHNLERFHFTQERAIAERLIAALLQSLATE